MRTNVGLASSIISNPPVCSRPELRFQTDGLAPTDVVRLKIFKSQKPTFGRRAEPTELANTSSGRETIAGCVASGLIRDILDFSVINFNLGIAGAAGGRRRLACASIGWIYAGANAAIPMKGMTGSRAPSSTGLRRSCFGE